MLRRLATLTLLGASCASTPPPQPVRGPLPAATAINPRIHVIAGGFHLVVTSDADIDRIVLALRNNFKVEYVAPGHCTGEPAFTALRRAFGDRYRYAGLDATLELFPASPE